MGKLFCNKYKKIDNQKNNQKYILKNSINVINKHLLDLSVSLSGDFAIEYRNSFFQRFNNSDLEMF
ncbi:hypothetical protein [Flavobacterium sp.]|uniref:hypothetical protein n=1 Tax=Flavobacterium sp. TaxID=239 RepID=UPI003752474D